MARSVTYYGYTSVTDESVFEDKHYQVRAIGIVKYILVDKKTNKEVRDTKQGDLEFRVVAVRDSGDMDHPKVKKK